jgi:hypothetical protein
MTSQAEWSQLTILMPAFTVAVKKQRQNETAERFATERKAMALERVQDGIRNKYCSEASSPEKLELQAKYYANKQVFDLYQGSMRKASISNLKASMSSGVCPKDATRSSVQSGSKQTRVAGSGSSGSALKGKTTQIHR